MYNKNNLAIAKIASATRIKPELACVAFYGDRTVATDSFRMIEMSADGKRHEPNLVYAEEVKAIKLKKGETIGAMDERLAPSISADGWPNVDIIMGNFKQDDYIEHNIGAGLMEGIMAVMKNVSTIERVTIKVPKEKFKPIIIEAVSDRAGDNQKARAFLMPMNR